MNKLSAPRETGTQKARAHCNVCGTNVPMVQSSYGSVSMGACPKCWPASAPSQLVAQQAAAELTLEAQEIEPNNE